MRYDSDANKAYQRARVPGGFLPFELRVVGGVPQLLQLAEYLVRVVVVVLVVLVPTQNQSHALGRGRRRYTRTRANSAPSPTRDSSRLDPESEPRARTRAASLHTHTGQLSPLSHTGQQPTGLGIRATRSDAGGVATKTGY